MPTITLALASIVSVAVGALLSFSLTTSRERTQTTLRMFRDFNDPGHHRARHRAARALDTAAESPTFSQLWTRPESIELYEDLWQIVYFWFELEALSERRLIHRRLAQGLFAYPYRYWAPLLRLLALRHSEEAAASGMLCPDWCAMWRDGSLDWLQQD